ncbi:MAG: hypothetical protein ACI845_003747 [Gammaproteobacteria bacterium]|jgi:hypothetical protein
MANKNRFISRNSFIFQTLAFLFLLLQLPVSVANLSDNTSLIIFKNTLACQETSTGSTDDSTDQSKEPVEEEEPDCD